MNNLRTRSFQVSSHVDGASVEEVWARIGGWRGVNAELGPLFSMTFPAQYSRIDDIPADGQSHFTSTILLLGLLPMDRHRFSLVDCVPPHYFDERSSNFMMRVWTHKRMLTPTDRGIEVTDECSMEPRLGWMGGLLLRVYRWVFKRRYQRLRQYFENRSSSRVCSAS